LCGRAQSCPSFHVRDNRSGAEFAKALFQLALAYPEAETIHLVMDNLSTHTRKSLTDLCGEELGGEELGGEIWDYFTPHYTPAHGSWLNQAEIEIGLFSRQCLDKRRIPDLATLRREAAAWNRRVNRDPAKIDWRFDRKAARRTFDHKRGSSGFSAGRSAWLVGSRDARSRAIPPDSRR
jgi:hypothetical protein